MLPATQTKDTKVRDLFDLIKSTYAKGATDEEVHFFAQVCAMQNLDPIKRQIYFTKMWDSAKGKESFAPIVSIDGMRSLAEETGLYAGQTIPLFCGPDGVWKEIWSEKGYPFACKVGVHRKDFKEPVYAIAYWSAYVKTTKNGDVTKFWRDMPTTMLAKCAEALALRKACPQKLSGLYTEDERAKDVIDVETKKEDVHLKLSAPTARKEFNIEHHASEIERLLTAEKGKYSCDDELSPILFSEVCDYIDDEYAKGNRASIQTLTFKKLTAERLSILARRYNDSLPQEEKFDEDSLRDIKKNAWTVYFHDTKANLEEVFAKESTEYIRF